MKKLFLLILILSPLISFGQSREIKDRFAEYTNNGYYQVDNRNIVVSRVIENVNGSKDDIYIRVKNYFARAYRDANSVLQTDDKTAGVIIGKGYYKNVYVLRLLGVTNTYLNAFHILRVDIKNNRVRIICSVDQWEEYNGKGHLDETVNILDYAPFTDKRFFDKGKQMEAFVNLIDVMTTSIDNLEQSIRSGSIAGETEEW